MPWRSGSGDPSSSQDRNQTIRSPLNCHCPVDPPPQFPYSLPAPRRHHSITSGRVSSPITQLLLVGSRKQRRELPAPAMAKLSPWLFFLVFFAAAAHASPSSVVTVSSDPENQCVYTVYVRTGSIWKGGTDARIGTTLLGSDGTGIRIEDLERWGGQMGAGHDYFERGNLDIFSGRGPCMRRAPCRMNLTSDGAGAHHGWYCNYLEVTATGPHMGCKQTLFTVEQWLATDAPPYRLYAVVDNCRRARRDEEADGDAGATAM